MRLLETIKIENRIPKNLEFHQHRMNYSRFRCYGTRHRIDLKTRIEIPDNLTNEVYKCRIVYSFGIHKIEFVRYEPKKVQSLKIVQPKKLNYEFKYAVRDKLNKLTEKKQDCDDILIIRNNLITDTSYANVAFWDGMQWITPKIPLLEGTQRALLLVKKQLVSQNITISDLSRFEKCKIMNAMLEFEAESFPIKNIKL